MLTEAIFIIEENIGKTFIFNSFFVHSNTHPLNEFSLVIIIRISELLVITIFGSCAKRLHSNTN